MTVAVKYCRRPKRVCNHGVSGMTITLATRVVEGMDSTDGRIVIMRPDAVAAAAVISDEVTEHSKTGTALIVGHDLVIFVAVFASIWTHMAEPLTLERLAADVGYTANYLNDLTRLHTGRPLGVWIAEMRMARARTALEHTDLPVAEIGVMCGYDDPAYFSRARPVDSRHAEVTIPLDVLQELETLRMLSQRAYSFAS
jgi:AraC-like DNA-binding protein